MSKDQGNFDLSVYDPFNNPMNSINPTIHTTTTIEVSIAVSIV